MPFGTAASPSPSSLRTDADLSIRRQCELLGLPRGQVYYQPVEVDQEAKRWREHIMARIDYWHTQMPYIGSRKLVTKLATDQIFVGRKLVRRLMCEMGIHALYPKANLSKRNFKESIVPYLLRNKVVSFPNQVWSIDITYIKMHHGHMYLTAIIDWYSRLIVGWSLSDTLDTDNVIAAVQRAISSHGTPAFLNSDQGCQFTSSQYKGFLKANHIVQSMDGKSRWADNIMIERWFRSLKTEEIYLNEYQNPRVLRRGIGNYIKQYNTFRPHQALGNQTPEAVYGAAFTTPTNHLDSLAQAG
ncbi:IS3 family transposase [Bengtsoniella intestinalis]|uniref:IS3 family transposase n=1 Tax=Bengtsoniella intestinalis TaxID=3073143 RepID=UPI00391FC1BC